MKIPFNLNMLYTYAYFFNIFIVKLE